MYTRRLLAVATVAATLGCSAPPEKERHQAEGAIAAAREVGAATYAPGDLQSAEAALEKYAAAVDQRDYRQALSLAVDARDTAYRAAKRSGDEKAAARSEAERLALDVARLLNAATTGPAPRTGTAKEREAHGDALERLQEARALIEKQEYRPAIAVLTPVAAQLQAEAGAGRDGVPRRPR